MPSIRTRVREWWGALLPNGDNKAEPDTPETFKYSYEDEWIIKFLSAVLWRLRPESPPFRIVNKRKWVGRLKFAQIARWVNIEDKDLLARLDRHEQRLRPRAWFATAIYLLAVSPFYWLLVLDYASLFSIVRPMSSAWISTVATLTFSYILLFIVAFIALVIAAKLVSIISDRRFADSLAAANVLFILVELNSDEALIDPAARKELLFRLDALARQTILLSLSYRSKGGETQNWVSQHFRYFEQYIRERERWVIAPDESTLARLREDFRELVPLYICQRYGQFHWPEVRVEPAYVAGASRNRWGSLRSFLVRAIALLVPAALIIALIWQPSVVPTGLDTKVLSLVLLTWLLLTLDNVLGLGVTKGIADMAKGIKELS